MYFIIDKRLSISSIANSFTKSLSFNEAKPLYDYFVRQVKLEVTAETGVFGADMQIDAINDGPVSIILDL